MSIQIPNPYFDRRSDELQLDVTQFYDRECEERTPRLPAEWEEQSGVQLTWPHAGTDWAPMLEEVQQCFARIASHVSHREKLLIVTPEPAKVMRQLAGQHVLMANTRFAKCPTNDTWARDHGGISLINSYSDDSSSEEHATRILDFRFNGWGEKFGASLDNLITRKLHKEGILHGELIDCDDFVLEGGSIESDGMGTVFTTSQCLLAPQRNQPMDKDDIERELKHRLHADRIIWLNHGNLIGDDTDGHIDTIVRICPNDTLLYIKSTDDDDEQHEDFTALEEELQALRTADGNPYRLMALPMTRPCYYDGERLPATYANFLVINGAVLVPTYSQPDLDREACRIIGEAFPGREIIPIDSQIIIRQHGSIHCLTMQYPL